MYIAVAVFLAFTILAGLQSSLGLASGNVPFRAIDLPAQTESTPQITEVAPPPTSKPPSLARESETVAASESVPAGFKSASASVNGTSIHYVTGGNGPGLILLHGFPENWSAYQEIMPQLAPKFQVVAVDLRGIGGSAPTLGGYDAATMAEDIFRLSLKLGIDRPYVVGHGLGGGVAYALARLHPSAVRGVMILDTAIAGVEPWDKIISDPRMWQVRFHQVPGLAERLLAGREAIYFSHVLRSGVADANTFSDADVARYSRAYTSPGQLTAAMNMYRAFDENERFGRQNRGQLDVEVTLAGGAVPGKGLGPLLDEVAKGLQATGLVNAVMVHEIASSGHYVIDQRPAEVAGLIERQASKSDREVLRASNENYDSISF